MKIRKGFMLREIDGSSIVVAVGQESKSFNAMIRLNGTGTFLWKLLESEISKEDILSKMLDVYDVDEKTAKEGIDTFVNKLKDNKILEE